jgi:hypothetical protein
VSRIERQKKLLNKDRILLVAGDAESLFNDGWKDWSPLLCDVLSNDHGLGSGASSIAPASEQSSGVDSLAWSRPAGFLVG